MSCHGWKSCCKCCALPADPFPFSHSIAHSTAFHRPLHRMCWHERRAPCCSFAPSSTMPLPSMFHSTPQFYLNNRLEINTASSQVQSASAMKRRRLAPGFRSRGGIHWMLAS